MNASALQEWLQMVYLLGAAQGVFLAAILVSRPRNPLPNRLLALLMLVFSMDLAMAVYHESGADHRYPHLIGLDYPLTLLYGPVVYLYAQSMSGSMRALGLRESMQFLPFAALALFMIPFYLESPGEKMSILAGTAESATATALALLVPIKVFHALAYVGMALAVLQRHRRAPRADLSDSDRVSLAWLRNLVIGIVALALVAGAMYAVSLRHNLPVMGMDPGHWYDDLTLLAVTIFVYTIGYLGLRQPEIFHPVSPHVDASALDVTPTTRRYARSGVSSDTARKHLRSILAVMTETKPYRRGDLTLQDLARELEISPHHLTEVLNTQVGKSFYDFVNEYRVREVQDRLESPKYQNWTILAIALEAGFNSKSAFYSVFRKHTGVTPSEYRRARAVNA